MRLAAIDCGTNTAMLLVADVVNGAVPRLRPVADFLEMPRLGQDLDRTGRLHPEAIERTLAEAVRRCDAGEVPGCPLIDALSIGA